ncbi:hypothetical protein Sste5346_002994 [Sporothrix stenoceras]|uniref:Transcription regulator n=1 Tax=Sporothrix stenoceras TaxID=5173 RepID=A0ABR3ZFV6_9PEZI
MDISVVSDGAAAAPESSATPNAHPAPNNDNNAVLDGAAATDNTPTVSNATTAIAEDTVMTTVESEPVAEVIEAKDVPKPAAAPVEASAAPSWAALSKSFSWLKPHPTFLIIFVGGSATPFAIQKDFLCAKSRFFYDYFYGASKPVGITTGANTNATGNENGDNSSNKETEHVVHLNDVSVEAFSYAQNFLYTGNVLPDTSSGSSSNNGAGGKEDPSIPSYDLLVSIWKLGDTLGIDGLCERALEAMAENRRLTQSIPDTNTLVQVWKDTPEGSSIRKLLLSWAAEYLRSSEGSRTEFAKALPQELLSELVVAMSSSYTDFWGLPSDPNGDDNVSSGAADTRSVDADIVGGKHYLEDDYDYGTQDGVEPSTNGTGSIHYRGSPPAPVAKRARYFDSYPAEPSTPALPASASAAAASPASALVGSTDRKPGRTALPSNSTSAPQRMLPKKRYSNVDMGNFTAEQKLEFCEDLVSRMMTGPGFWTRLVGPFKEPVDPVSENIPDYFDKVKRPMDLGTIKQNLKDRKYKAPEEFLADMRQIFANVYMYWNKGDTIWTTCERLEKSFEDKYSHMNKWLSKREDEVLM